jgi:hypothetical protein
MRYLKLLLILVACVSAARADEGAFTTGPIFTDYGPVADVATDDLLPGVEMALSAMTAHALLQNSGFTLNPF